MPRAALDREEHAVLACIQNNRPYQGHRNTSWASVIKLESVCCPVMEKIVSHDGIMFPILCVDI